MKLRYAMSAALASFVFVFAFSAISALATTITSSRGTVATPAIKAESVGDLVLHNPIARISCSTSLEGNVETHGKGLTAKGNLSSLAFSGCKNEWHVTTVTGGSLELHWTSGNKGIITSSGATVEATRGGTVCRYATANTYIGTFTGGMPARVHVEAAIPFHSGSLSCATGATLLTGSFKVSSPSSLFVEDGPENSSSSVTSPTGTVATPTIKAESEGHIGLDHPLATFQCQWAFEGAVVDHGEGNASEVSLSNLSTTGCTDSWHATTVAPGELEIDWTSGYNGTVTWSGGTVEMTRFGTTCRYKSASTEIGIFTGGTPATIDVEGSIPLHGGSPLCGESALPMTGSIEVSSPTSLFVDEAQVEPGTSVTSPTGTIATPSIKAESEGHVALDNPIASIECASSVEGAIEGHGKESRASGSISVLSFSGCTNTWHVTVVSAGDLVIDSTSGYDGTVTSYGATVEATRFGVICRYFSLKTVIGKLTGGSPAALDLEANIPFHSGSFLCGSGATRWTGSYKVTSPSSLFVDKVL